MTRPNEANASIGLAMTGHSTMSIYDLNRILYKNEKYKKKCE
jgi:hypothetical protein